MKTILLLIIPNFFLFSQNVVKVSFYDAKFNGRKTANGEIFDNNNFTAAHKKIKFNTFVKITNVENNKSVVVKINDRGPYIRGREFDLTLAAFKSIANVKKGVIKVKYEILDI